MSIKRYLINTNLRRIFLFFSYWLILNHCCFSNIFFRWKLFYCKSWLSFFWLSIHLTIDCRRPITRCSIKPLPFCWSPSAPHPGAGALPFFVANSPQLIPSPPPFCVLVANWQVILARPLVLVATRTVARWLKLELPTLSVWPTLTPSRIPWRIFGPTKFILLVVLENDHLPHQNVKVWRLGWWSILLGEKES